MGSLLPFDSGPDDPGGGGTAVLKGRLLRQLPGNLEASRSASCRAQHCVNKTLAVLSASTQRSIPLGRRRQSWPPGDRIARPNPNISAAMSFRYRTSFDPPHHFRCRFRFLGSRKKPLFPLCSVVVP